MHAALACPRFRSPRLSARVFGGREGRDVVVEFLHTEGKSLAVLQSPAEVARQLTRIERESQATEGVRVVRHDEHQSDLVATESFVTATPLPSFSERPRQR